jgi:hypothetical protein
MLSSCLRRHWTVLRRMRETFPVRLLQLVLQATPEERVAIERFLGGQPLPGRQQKLLLGNEAGQAVLPKSSGPDEPTLSLAAKVFELLTALDPGKRLRKAPPITVFLLRYRRNLSRSEIARVCGCDKSLVAVRLRAIQEKLPWQPRQLRELSAQVSAMQEALSDPRARRIYRRGAVYGSQEEEEGFD